MWPSNTSGATTNTLTETATNLQDFYQLGFNDGAKSYAQANIMMPSDYDGTTVTATFVWTVNGTAMTGAVVWGCQWNQYHDAQAIDTTWGTAQTVTDNYGSASTGGFATISNATSAITTGGATGAASQLALFRVYRDGANGSDTQTSVANLIGVMIAYTRTA